jgi:hypothetical protein
MNGEKLSDEVIGLAKLSFACHVAGLLPLVGMLGPQFREALIADSDTAADRDQITRLVDVLQEIARSAQITPENFTKAFAPR